MAHKQRAIVQMGKEAITKNLVSTIDDALEAHELVKISLLKNCPLEVAAASEILSKNTQSEIVQKIGHTFVLYRKSKKAKLVV